GGFSASGERELESIVSWNGTGWSNVGPGLSGRVLAVARYGNEFVLGGAIDTVDGEEAGGLAIWDGISLRPFPVGTDGVVYAFHEYEGDLIVGGSFRNIGTMPVGGIAAWDGDNWSPYRDVTALYPNDTAVQALTVYQGSLIIGGTFLFFDDVPARGLITWANDEWYSFGTGLSGIGTTGAGALLASGSELWIGGTFTSVSGTPAVNVVRWDGAMFHPAGDGLNSTVRALAEYQGQVVVGGNFSSTGATPVSRLGVWNGTTWTTFAGGANASVSAIRTIGATLLAGGDFISVGGVSARSLARWDGQVWSEVSGGADARVSAIAVSDSTLLVGGRFRYLAGRSSRAFGVLVDSQLVTDAPGVEGGSGPSVQVANRPNPFTARTELVIDVDRAGDLTIESFDLRGRRVSIDRRSQVPAGRTSVGWTARDESGAPLPAGVYFVRVSGPGGSATRKIVSLGQP
ncbi:MAG: T9SS type A sorting domain-containing protein, partial [Planctomycetes bacterium]|nr:T9SS type A sorting domain-containing protein [Planctomycetota bacterium]